ncbi:MAG: hypothetical protein ABIR79_24265 [Candidatus Binatia bacterium]|jgi:hypothetical protein
MSETAARLHLRQQLSLHVSELGYSLSLEAPGPDEPEILRMSPVRRRIAYGETVLKADLKKKRCHDRLRLFSQRRTRRRGTILFFIGVAAEDQLELETLLTELEIRSGIRGGHVHVVPIAKPEPAARRASSKSSARG